MTKWGKICKIKLFSLPHDSDSAVIMSSTVCITWEGLVRHDHSGDTCQTSPLPHEPNLCISSVHGRVHCWEGNCVLWGALQGNPRKQAHVYEHRFKWLTCAYPYALSNTPATSVVLLLLIRLTDCNLRYRFVFKPDLSSSRWADWILKWSYFAFCCNALACEYKDKMFEWFCICSEQSTLGFWQTHHPILSKKVIPSTPLVH